MRKMVQLGHWSLQFVLLCLFWQLGTPCFGGTEHRSVGVHEEFKLVPDEDIGKIVFFGIFVLIGEIGKKLDKGYRCPTYCDADHKHIYWEIKTIPVDTVIFFEKNLAFDG